MESVRCRLLGVSFALLSVRCRLLGVCRPLPSVRCSGWGMPYQLLGVCLGKQPERGHVFAQPSPRPYRMSASTLRQHVCALQVCECHHQHAGAPHFQARCTAE